MTPQEFKAWFDGFTEAFTGVPNKAQWTRIKARVAEIDGKPVTERVFVDRYWPHYYPYYPYWSTQGFSISNTVGHNAVGQNAVSVNATSMWEAPDNMASFNSADAMLALGRADAQSLSQ